MITPPKDYFNIVIGYPLAHTQSPLLHNMLYEILNLPAHMSAYPSEDLRSLIKKIKKESVALTAVNMPFKGRVFQYLDYFTPEVKALKVTNTIIQKHGKLYGYNTDIYGIKFALANINFKNKKILIIGAGGSARACCYVFKAKGANLYILNKTLIKAKRLVNMFGGNVIKEDQINQIDFDCIVNTTPVGQYPDVKKSILPDYDFKPQQIVIDMVYNPEVTQLLKDAEKKCAIIISGIEIFIYQALRQVQLWHNDNTIIPGIMKKSRDLLIKNQSRRKNYR